MAEILNNEQHHNWQAPKTPLDSRRMDGEPINGQLEGLKTARIEAIRSNPDLKPISFDPNKFYLRSDNGKVIEYYAGADQYSREVCNGKAFRFSIDGQVYDLVVDESNPKFNMGYESSRDTFTIGNDGLEDFKKNPEIALASFMHENAHMKFLSLNESQQKEICDQLINDSNLRPILEKFAHALYSDKLQYGSSTAGELYLYAHNQQNPANRDRFSQDGQIGLKDNRSIIIDVDGKKFDVSLPMLVSELISYTSGLEVSPAVFKQVQEDSRQLRGSDDARYLSASAFYDQVKDQEFYKNLFSTDQNAIKHYLSLIATGLS